MLTVLLLIASGLVILASLLPLSNSTLWWIRGFDFPRLQIALAGCLVLMGTIVTWPWQSIEWSAYLAVSAAVIGQFLHILPFSRLAKKQVMDARHFDDAATISVMIANVLMTNRRYSGLIEQVQSTDPDILLTLETDMWWQQKLQSIEDRYPYGYRCPLDNLYGMHLYSRLELDDVELRYLIEDRVPSISCRVTLRNGERILFYALHPAPPSPSENKRSVERDGELLIVGREVKTLGEPAIVTGDMNDVAWSKTTLLFRRISGLLDPRLGRGMYNSFHAGIPFLRWPLDHLFHSETFRLVEIRRMAAFGSDHFPLYVRLAYQPHAPGCQAAGEERVVDRREAGRRIREARQHNGD